MIRVTLLNDHFEVIRIADFATNRVRIGRGSKNDFILTDPHVSRQHLTVEDRHGDLHLMTKDSPLERTSSRIKIKIGDSLILIELLNVIDDEITLNDFHMPKAQREWAAPIAAFLLLNFLLVLSFILYDISSMEIHQQFQYWGGAIASEFVLMGLVSMVSKAINGQYRFARVLQIISWTGVLFILAQTRIFGLMWSLGSWSWFSEARHSIFMLVFSIAFWWLGREVFDHTPKWLRAGILVLLLSFATVSEFSNHLPFQEKWVYFQNEVPPPLPDWQESKTISVDDLLSKMQGAKPSTPPKR